MKNKISFIFIGLILFTFPGIFAQTNFQKPVDYPGGLNIKGKINGLKEGEVAYLKIWDVEKKQPLKVDSALVKEGIFHLTYKVVDGPRLFWIGFSKHEHLLAVLLDNDNVSIICDRALDSIKEQSIFKYVNVGGSETAKQFLYLAYGVNDGWYYATNKVQAAIRKYKDSLLTKENLAYISGLLKAKDLLNENIGQILHARPIKESIPNYFDNSDVQLRRESFFYDLYNNFSPEIKNSYYGKLMKDEMPLCMGQPAPVFKFTTDDGKAGSLTDVIKKNKITVLHFWSNGSVDRARIQDELSTVYKKYKSKGLEVVSVSSDFNLNQWKKVIQESKLPGYHVFDQKQESLIAEQYKIDPQWTINILIDQNGKMIRFDADGPSLMGYLYQLFGE